MSHKTATTAAHTIGIDTGKNTLHLIWPRRHGGNRFSRLTNKTRRYPPRSASWIEEMEKRSQQLLDAPGAQEGQRSRTRQDRPGSN